MAEMTKDEALKLALEALNSGVDVQIGRVVWTEYDSSLVQEAITAIKEALAHTQEPQIAFNSKVIGYVAPQRTWVGLSEQQQSDIEDASEMMIGIVAFSLISDTLKKKNT